MRNKQDSSDQKIADVAQMLVLAKLMFLLALILFLNVLLNPKAVAAPRMGKGEGTEVAGEN